MSNQAPPAAFGRLCVETFASENRSDVSAQPPSGGCVLKQIITGVQALSRNQPPSGGCVLKQGYRNGDRKPYGHQPPSGGCVLKPSRDNVIIVFDNQPPSGGCVLKPSSCARMKTVLIQPPSGGCVLKRDGRQLLFGGAPPAAFGRLCVETNNPPAYLTVALTSRLRAAVC